MTARPKRLEDIISLADQQGWLAITQPQLNHLRRHYERGERYRGRKDFVAFSGQNVFRRQQLLYWCGKRPLTGIDEPRLLRASHIKAWASCESNAERIQIYNGVLLAAHLDTAFDAGLISFADDGRMLRGLTLSDANFAALGVPPQARLELTPGHRAYLSWRRRRHGFPE
ncbi:MAG TPA: HNH endonuclease signature motif containing protein [Methylocystis sp.]|nr:HNH endonuclease signature motif containing protein [Methylocystis sp.]